jgi:hypothetical protein
MSDVQTTEVVQETSAPIEGVQEENNQSQEVKVQVPEKAEESKKEDFLAPKFAALSRKEKQIREMEKAIKTQQAEVEKMRQEWESKSKSTQESESQLLQKLKKNPLKALQELGYDFDKLTEMQINEQNPTPQMLIEQIKEELRAEIQKEVGGVKENLKEKEIQEAKERHEAAVNGYKSELQEFVSQASDKYELILANDATDLMFETAEAYYQQTGKVPSHEEVADAVEEHLEERAKEILKLKKFQTAQKPEASKAEQPAKTAPTLSNTLAAEVPKSGSKYMSAEQSLAEASKLLRWGDE